MARKTTLKHQWFKLQQEINCVGHSRHEAKQVQKEFCQNNDIKWNPLKTAGIYSESTYDNYMDVGNHFINWLKEEHQEVKLLKDDLTKDLILEYLQERIEDGLRSATIDKDQAAFNKIFVTFEDMYISTNDLKSIGYEPDTDVIKGRQDHEFDSKYDTHVLLAESCGSRRSSICEVSSKHHKQYVICPETIYKNEDTYYASLREKGGLFRNSKIIEMRVDEIKKLYEERHLEIQERTKLRTEEEFLQEYKSFSKPFCDKDSLPLEEPIHSCRRDYAQTIYDQFATEKEARGEELQNNCKSRSGRDYDQSIVLEVSNQLGHGRPDVVLNYYLL